MLLEKWEAYITIPPVCLLTNIFYTYVPVDDDVVRTIHLEISEEIYYNDLTYVCFKLQYLHWLSMKLKFHKNL